MPPGPLCGSRNGRTLSLATFLLLSLSAAGCRAPEVHAADADREVYAMVLERRAELFGEPGGFTIDPPADSLRQRILRGEWDTSQPLGLVECLEIAAENSREVQSQRETLYRSALDLSLERWQYSTQLFADTSGSVSGTADEASTADVDSSLGFSRLLGTGASIVTTLGNNMFRVVSTGNYWTELTNLSMSITQPLLRGAGRAIALEPLTQAERNLVYAVRSYERFRRTYAVDVAGRVYGLLQAIDELENEERNYRDLVLLRQRNEALAAAGRLSDIQADQARQDELGSENRLISLRASLARQWDQFNLFLGLPVGVQLTLDPAEFDALIDSDPLMGTLDELASSEYALGHRLDHLTVSDQVADSARRLAIAEDALGAGLSLGLSANASSPNGAGDLKDVRYQETDWTASLALDLPIDRKRERNSLRSSQISLAAAERGLAENQDSIHASVLDAFRAVRDSRQSIAIQRGAMVLARRRVESAKLNLAAGRAETRDLLDAQASLVSAENNTTSSLIQFNLARFDLHLELETLRVDEGGIHVRPDLMQVSSEQAQ
ncbi:MAG TPA: TolC family protein [Planctomycetota bacterium]|nr:TolC family protein [Planctomycetota bacterium]